MKRILDEPLLHFLLIGAGLFIAYGLMSSPSRSTSPTTIVVTAGQVEHLAASFAKTWRRPPTEPELEGLIDEWVRDEVATREAMALGLDEGDTVVRRRLRQKLEFASDDIAGPTEPTDADLNAYLQAHPDSFRVEPAFTFSQVYLDPAKHGDDLGRDATRVLARLRQADGTTDAAALGDSLLLEPTFRSAPSSEIAKQFGEEFASKFGELPLGQWHGPIASGYGVHLVWVSERTAGGLPALADVREAVRREWANAQRLEANEKYYRELLRRYTVTIESPKAAEAKNVAVVR
jgi:hypothetical protein